MNRVTLLIILAVFGLWAILSGCGGGATEPPQFTAQETPDDPDPTPVFTRSEAQAFLAELYALVGQFESGGGATHACSDGGSMSVFDDSYDPNTMVGALFIEINGCRFGESSADSPEFIWRFELFGTYSATSDVDPVTFEGVFNCPITMVGGWGIDDEWDFCGGQHLITASVDP